MRSVLFLLSAFVAAGCAKTVVVTVGGNTTSNPMGVFQPASVIASPGDVVLFNFTEGNHTATQSTFAGPCIPAHFTNASINGFDSSFRETDNGTAVTQLSFTVADNNTVWFFDFNTCAQGGVGGININESSLQTLAGFERNAIRLNGTAASSSASSSSHSATGSTTATSPSSTSSTSSTSSAANRIIAQGAAAALPAVAMLVALAL